MESRGGQSLDSLSAYGGFRVPQMLTRNPGLRLSERPFHDFASVFGEILQRRQRFEFLAGMSLPASIESLPALEGCQEPSSQRRVQAVDVANERGEEAITASVRGVE